MALTRKNALFAGSDGGARHWAFAMTSIQTAKLNGIDPMVWLTDVLERVVSGRTKSNDLHTPLSWNWATSNASHPTAALAAQPFRSSTQMTKVAAAPLTFHQDSTSRQPGDAAPRGDSAARMIAPPSGVRVWLATGATDMRRDMNGLASLIQVSFGSVAPLACPPTPQAPDHDSVRHGYSGPHHQGQCRPHVTTPSR